MAYRMASQATTPNPVKKIKAPSIGTHSIRVPPVPRFSPLFHFGRAVSSCDSKATGLWHNSLARPHNASNARLAPSCVCQASPNTAVRDGAPAPNTNNQQSRRTPCRRTGNRWIPRPNPLTVSLHWSCTSQERRPSSPSGCCCPVPLWWITSHRSAEIARNIRV